MPSIIPVLVHPDQFDSSSFASRFLVDCDKKVPLVAYLRVDDKGNSKHITWQAVEKSKGGLEELDSRAMKDLSNRAERPGWEPENITFRGTEVTILRRTGDFLTAADIMDPEVLEIAHNYFQSEVIHLTIPHTSCMIASDSPDYIHAVTNHEFQAAQNQELEQLFEQTFRIKDGEIAAVLDVEPPRPEPEFQVIDGTNVLYFKIPFKGDFQAMHDSIVADFDQYAPGLCENEHFHGGVVFEVLKGQVPLSADQINSLNDLGKTLAEIAAHNGWVAPGGIPITVGIKHPQQLKKGMTSAGGKSGVRRRKGTKAGTRTGTKAGTKTLRASGVRSKTSVGMKTSTNVRESGTRTRVGMRPGVPAEEEESNGLAIAAFVCGLLSFLCATSLPAIILGILALRKKTSKGKGLAITGIILGVVMPLILMAFYFLIFAAAFSHAKAQSTQVQCAGNLKQVGLACMMYSGENSGQYPPSLQMLVEKSIINASGLTCPKRDGQGIYMYFGSGAKDSDPKARIVVLACDRTSHNGTMNFLFADGHVQSVVAESPGQAIKENGWVVRSQGQ